jgi:hypothetical protein
MKQIRIVVYRVIFVTFLVAACSVGTSTPNHNETVMPVHTETATNFPTPVLSTPTHETNIPASISTGKARSFPLEDIGVWGTPQYSHDGRSIILPTKVGAFVIDTASYEKGHYWYLFLASPITT